MIDTQTLRTVAQSYDIVFGKPGEPKQTRRGNHVRNAADELDRLYALEQELIALKKKIKADKAPPKCEFCGKFSNDLYACDGDEGPDACPTCRKKYIEECKNEN